MGTSKTLAWSQIGVMFASIVLSIIFIVMFTIGGGSFDSSGVRGTMSGLMGIAISSLVLAVMQIVFSSKKNEDSKKALVAGIIGLFTIVPLVGTIGIVSNTLVLSEKR